MSYRSGAAGDQNRVAITRICQMNGMDGGEERDSKAGADVEADIVRKQHGLLGRQGYILGGRTEGPLPLAVPDPDAFADPTLRDAVSDGVNHAGAVAVGHHERGRHGAKSVNPGLPVGRIDAARHQPDADFSGPRHGGLEFAELEHVARASLASIEGCTHLPFHSKCRRLDRQVRAETRLARRPRQSDKPPCR